MLLKAVHTIIRHNGKKPVRVEAGKDFECPGSQEDVTTEAGGYLKTGAAVVSDTKSAEKAPAKAPAKAAAKAATKAETKAETPAAKKKREAEEKKAADAAAKKAAEDDPLA